MTKYDKVIENASCLAKWHAKPAMGVTAQTVAYLRDDTLSALAAYAAECHPGWEAAWPEPDAKPRVQACRDKTALARNQVGMLTGCLNRIAVTDEKKEFQNLARSAHYYVRVLACLCLESLGQDAIDWFEWKCPLAL